MTKLILFLKIVLCLLIITFVFSGSKSLFAVDSSTTSQFTTAPSTIIYASSTVPVSTVYLPPPFAVTGFNYMTSSSGQLQAGVNLSSSYDPNSVSSSSAYIVTADSNTPVPGQIMFITNGIGVITSAPAIQGIGYKFILKGNIKSTNGTNLANDYISPVFYLQSVTALPPVTVQQSTSTVVSQPNYYGYSSTTANIATTTSSTITNRDYPTDNSTTSTNQDYTTNNIATSTNQDYTVYNHDQSSEIDLQSQSGNNNLKSTIKLSFKDQSGQPVPFATISFHEHGTSVQYTSTADSSGLLTITIPFGNYTVDIFPPTGITSFITDAPQEVKIQSNSISKTIVFSQPHKTITGSILFSNGLPVTNAEIEAYSSQTQHWVSSNVDQTGHYSLLVSGGEWKLALHKNNTVATWTYTDVLPTVKFSEDNSIETQQVNLTIPQNQIPLQVQTTNSNGETIHHAEVIIDSSSSQNENKNSGNRFFASQTTDESGFTTFYVVPGTYYVRGFLPENLGYTNPNEQLITVSSNATNTATIVFNKISFQLPSISGHVFVSEVNPVAAKVWAWSDQGGSIETDAHVDGSFSLSVSSGTWHVSAAKDIDGIPFKSSDVEVKVSDASVFVDLALTKIKGVEQAVVTTQSSDIEITTQTDKGAKITLPPHSTDVNRVNVEVRPTAEAPSQPGARIFGTAYDITLKDTLGTKVHDLKQEAEISLPYDINVLHSSHTSEDKLIPTYFDESTGSWVKIDAFTIDKIHHTINIKVNHLTRFAIVLAAEIIPPDAPLNVKALALSIGGIKLSWINPTTAFDHIKIYRSLIKNQLGSVLIPELNGHTYIDTSIQTKLPYFYTIRTVDLSGNESTNISQIVKKGKVASKKRILRILSIGSKGHDVEFVQLALAKDGEYLGDINGVFDYQTKKAVIMFQENHAADILVPLGLTNGTGIVGRSTRLILNRLLSSL